MSEYMRRAISEHLDLIADEFDRTGETDLSAPERVIVSFEVKRLAITVSCSICGLGHHPEEGCTHHSIEASDEFLGIPRHLQ